MRFVVTGAAGFIGSHLTDALLGQGHDVVAIDCFTDYYDPALKEDNAAAFDVARLDLAADELALDGFDGVFHLAGQPGVRSFGAVFDDYVRRNLVATQRVFESAARSGVRLVFASSSSVYGDAERYPTPEDARPTPISPYGITKLGCEQLAYAYAKSFGLEAAVLRYFTVYGPRQRPDMALARGRRASVALVHLRRRRGRGDDRGDGARPGGCALQRRGRRGGDDARRDRHAGACLRSHARRRRAACRRR